MECPDGSKATGGEPLVSVFLLVNSVENNTTGSVCPVQNLLFITQLFPFVFTWKKQLYTRKQNAVVNKAWYLSGLERKWWKRKEFTGWFYERCQTLGWLGFEYWLSYLGGWPGSLSNLSEDEFDPISSYPPVHVQVKQKQKRWGHFPGPPWRTHWYCSCLVDGSIPT